jgi:N-methylhydantoinase A
MTALKIGIDIGGTFTDIVAVNEAGRLWTTKASSTPEDFSRGVVDSLTALAETMGIGRDELLASVVEFVNGSTVATNAIAQWRGARVGLLVTRGFRDVLRIARSARSREFDLHKQRALPEIVPRSCIREISERVDSNGRTVFPLDQAEVERVVRELVEDEGVESLAVAYLWSFRNAEHERLTGACVKRLYPHLHVSLSHEIHPVYREYERTVTTVFNSYVGVSVARYLHGLEDKLGRLGLGCPVDIMQCGGGRANLEVAKRRPVELLQSGPVAGGLGAGYLGRVLERRNLIVGDMGGTSFDTALIVNHEIKKRTRVTIDGFLTGLTMLDVASVGAGGGSIAWIDDRGMPRVGPHSAGAQPGPACYGRGGTLPTVTDASVQLGHLNPEYFLGGRMRIYPERAEQVLVDGLAGPLGISTAEAAIGVRELVVASMANAVRSITVEQGHDPRIFTMLTYGGNGPMFIADICRHLGIDEIIIPPASATFSAYGLLVAEHSRDYVRTYHWLDDDDPAALTTVMRELEMNALTDFRALGVDAAHVSLTWEVDARFEGQFFEFPTALPRQELTPVAVQRFRERFIKQYEERFGAETAWRDSRIEVVNCRLQAREPKQPPPLVPRALAPSDPAACRKGERIAYMSARDGMRSVPVYAGGKIGPGTTIAGAAIIEEDLTTILVPGDFAIRKDGYDNYLLSRQD